jgi:hypothetical protein
LSTVANFWMTAGSPVANAANAASRTSGSGVNAATSATALRHRSASVFTPVVPFHDSVTNGGICTFGRSSAVAAAGRVTAGPADAGGACTTVPTIRMASDAVATARIRVKLTAGVLSSPKARVTRTRAR